MQNDTIEIEVAGQYLGEKKKVEVKLDTAPVKGRMPVTISRVAKSGKAYLVTSNGTDEVWVQKRSYRETDTSVSAKVFAKAIWEKEEQAAAWQASKDRGNSYCYLGKVKRETEKAVLVDATLYQEETDQSITRGVWFPKSQMDEHGAGKYWLCERKAQELVEENGIGGATTVSFGGYDDIF